VDATSFGVGGLVPLPIPTLLPSQSAKETVPPSDAGAAEESGESKSDDARLFDVMKHTASFGMHEAPKQEAPADMVYKKVRHNLTERKRVDRLNQLFNRLSAAVDEDEPSLLGAPLTLECGSDLDGSFNDGSSTDGKNPSDTAAAGGQKKERSKAEVLESALNVIQDLRKQLAEERLARSLGVTDLETIAGSMVNDEMCDDDVDEAIGVSAYQNVTW